MSMLDFLDEYDVVNSIRLQIRHASGINKSWIIVEGITDHKLFSKLIDGDSVEIEISHGGLSSVKIAVSELLKETDSVLGILDADFIRLDDKTVTDDNIFLSDFHDAEMMIIACDNAFNAIMREYITNGKAFNSLRQKLLQSISFIGGLRWINDADNLKLNFKNMGFGGFYNGERCCLEEDTFLREVMNRSPNKKRTVSTKEVKNKIKNVSDFFNLCNGHDFQKVFALHMNSINKKGVKHEEIGKAFRIAYRFEDFQKTYLYTQLKEWSDAKSNVLFNEDI